MHTYIHACIHIKPHKPTNQTWTTARTETCHQRLQTASVSRPLQTSDRRICHIYTEDPCSTRQPACRSQRQPATVNPAEARRATPHRLRLRLRVRPPESCTPRTEATRMPAGSRQIRNRMRMHRLAVAVATKTRARTGTATIRLPPRMRAVKVAKKMVEERCLNRRRAVGVVEAAGMIVVKLGKWQGRILS